MNAELPPNKVPSRRKHLVYFVVGVVFFVLGLLVAQRTDLDERLTVDLRGEVVQGSAERVGEGIYRLKYKHPGGSIYARTYHGDVPGVDPQHETSIHIAYNLNKPEEFQPAGVSYLPALAVIVLSTLGAGLVFYANHRMVRQNRRRKIR